MKIQPAPQHRAIDRSRRRVNRAVSMAAFSGWTMAFFGGISLLTGWGSALALLVGALLVLCALNELSGRRKLRALEADGARRLSRNQVFIALGIAGYCLACALEPAVINPDLRAALAQAGMADSTERIFDLAARITKAVYFFVIAATLIVQTFVAWFYVSREKDILRLRSVIATAS